MDYSRRATQRELLPGSGPDLHIVLFWREQDQGLESIMAAFRGTAWPKYVSAGVLELDSAENVRDWFGIFQTPAVVAIADGAILGIEFDCSLEACERLLACAQRQLRLLDGAVV